MEKKRLTRKWSWDEKISQPFKFRGRWFYDDMRCKHRNKCYENRAKTYPKISKIDWNNDPKRRSLMWYLEHVIDASHRPKFDRFRCFFVRSMRTMWYIEWSLRAQLRLKNGDSKHVVRHVTLQRVLHADQINLSYVKTRTKWESPTMYQPVKINDERLVLSCLVLSCFKHGHCELAKFWQHRAEVTGKYPASLREMTALTKYKPPINWSFK